MSKINEQALIKKALDHHDKMKATFRTIGLREKWSESKTLEEKEKIVEEETFSIKFSFGGHDYEYRSIMTGRSYVNYAWYFLKDGNLKTRKVFSDLLK